MKKKPRVFVPVPLLAPIAKAFIKDDGVDLYKSTSLRAAGKVFAMIVKDQRVVKLSAARVATLVDEGRGDFFRLGPTKVMKEWFAAPVAQSATWLKLAKESRAFIEKT